MSKIGVHHQFAVNWFRIHFPARLPVSGTVVKFSLSCQTNNSPTLFPDSQLVCFSLNNAYSASLAYIWIISNVNVFNPINLPLVGSFWREVSISLVLVQPFSSSSRGTREGRGEKVGAGRRGLEDPPAGRRGSEDPLPAQDECHPGWLFRTLMLVSGGEGQSMLAQSRVSLKGLFLHNQVSNLNWGADNLMPS